MTEVKKDTYTLTIENDTEKSMITSVKKGTDERNMITDEINLEDDDASAKLTKAINPVAVAAEADTSSQAAETSSQSADTSSHSADTPPPPPPVAAAEEAAKQKLLDTQLTGKYTKYTLGTLMNVLSNKNGRNSIYRFRLLYHINDQLNNWTGKNGEELTSAIKQIVKDDPEIINTGISFNQQGTNLYDLVLGGTHHTRKRTHKPRNTKSNTRKGHIYRTNHRRTHGKSSARGKKQTRRIANR
jgi:hypothetical protein